MRQKQPALLVITAPAAFLLALTMLAGSSASASAQRGLNAPSRYGSEPLYAPRPLTIRRGAKRGVKRAAKPPRPAQPLRAHQVICPRGMSAESGCVPSVSRRSYVALRQAPGADAFRLGSSVLAPPRVPPTDADQTPGYVQAAILAAYTRPPVYPDLYARLPAFGHGFGAPLHDVHGFGFDPIGFGTGGAGLSLPALSSGGIALPALGRGL